MIDDEKNICIVVRACLEHLTHWEVLTSQSGSEGLLVASSESPHAILLDVEMPSMDGVEVFAALQGSPLTQGIPVILLTVKVSQLDLDRYAQLGVAGVISKPFDPLKLPGQIAELLGWSDKANASDATLFLRTFR
ncbi:response regulator [Scytonema sp. HK-05]|uniref:response regulator n=1 Tax=Scytonema sp. HK-05 TaxID=1137095 RepID=UPI00307635D2